MNDQFVFQIVAWWCICGLIGGLLGNFMKNRALAGAVMGAVFGPIGWIALVIFFKDMRRQCRYCEGTISPTAQFCKHCGKDQVPGRARQVAG